MRNQFVPGQIALHSAAISITLEIMFLTTSFFIYFYFWLRWVFVAAHGLTLVAASGGATLRCGALASHCSGLSCCGSQALGHAGFSSCGAWAQ